MAVCNVDETLLKDYCEYIRAVYLKSSLSGSRPITDSWREYVESKTWTYEVGSVYIKIIACEGGRQMSSHSFIVNKAGQFQVGDILKSASWKAPAKNFARGNVIAKNFKRVSWTGVS